MNRISRFFRQHKTLVLSLGFIVLFSLTVSYAAPLLSPYAPGQTLDPQCAPGEANCTVSAGAPSPWTVTGNNIYYNTGNVGIGTTAPQSALDVNGTVSSTGLNVSGTYTSGTQTTSITVASPTNLQASITYDPGNTHGYQYIADGTHTQINYRVYAYKTVNGGEGGVLSTSYTTLSSDLTDDGSGNQYAVQLSWDPVDGADGYVVMVSDGGAYDKGTFVGESSFVDDGSEILGTVPISSLPTSFDVTTVGNPTTGSTISGGLTVTDGINVTGSSTFGSGNTAVGTNAFAFGDHTHADSLDDVVVGAYNTGGGDPSNWNATDPLFEVGNGTDADDPGDAFYVQKDGTTVVGGHLYAEGDGATVYGNLDIGGTLTCNGGPCSTGYSGSGIPSFQANGGDAEGDYSVSIGSGTEALEQYSTAIGFVSMASGNASTALGAFTTASGQYSMALGEDSTASGYISTSFGQTTLASGDFSTVFGNQSIASGTGSTAFGDHTTAASYDSTVLGAFNVGGGDVQNWNDTDPLFEVGNGTDPAHLSDALLILKNGDTTISGSLNVGNGNVVDDSEYPGCPGVAVFGESSNATGCLSVVIGTESTASGSFSVAVGFEANATGSDSVALGSVTASGASSIAAGIGTEASGINTTAFGSDTVASGDISTTFGSHTTASSAYSAAFGQYNVDGGLRANIWVDTDPLFEIGNGTGSSHLSDALLILKNGNTTIGGNLTVNGGGSSVINGDLDIEGALTCGGASCSTPSQWTTNGSDISYTGGNVGIGTTTPQSALDVNGTVSSLGLNVHGSYTPGSVNTTTTTVTMDTPTNLQASITYDPGNTHGYQYIADGTHTQINYRVYAFDESNDDGGYTVISSSYGTLPSDLFDDGSGDHYAVNLSWDPVAGASTYFVVLSDGDAYDEAFDTNGSTSVVDDGNENFDSEIILGDIPHFSTSHTGSATTTSAPINGNTIAGGLSVEDGLTVHGPSTFGDLSNLAVGDNSAAFGDHVTASSLDELVIGRYNWVDGDSFEWNDDDPIFQVGNGTDADDPSDAFDVLKNGDTHVEGALNVSDTNGEGSEIGGDLDIGGTLTCSGGPCGTDYSGSGPQSFQANAGDASGTYSLAIGLGSNASAFGSMAFGSFTTASGQHSMAFGDMSVASGSSSTAFGDSTASGDSSTAFGDSTASGDSSTSFNESYADSYLSTTFGANNIGGGDPSSWVDTDPLFEVGDSNGGDPSDALLILKNGDTTIGGNLDVTGTLSCNGSSCATSSQWATSGSDVSYTAGRVGIGTASPASLLSVGSSSQFTVDGSGNVAASSISLLGANPTVIEKTVNPSPDSALGVKTDAPNGSITEILNLSAVNSDSGEDNYNEFTFLSVTPTPGEASNVWDVTVPGRSFTMAGLDDISSYAVAKAGLAGGQTLVGGTGPNDALTLQGTAGNGTLTSPALNVNVGNGGATNAVTVLNSGYVGIANAAPSYALQVGSSSVSGVVARFQNSAGTCDINPTTASLTCSSDMTLKDNVANLADNSAWSFNTNITPSSQSVLDEVLALNPVRYNWDTESNPGNDPALKHVGFIAQEVREVLPDLVATDPQTHLLSLNYTGLIPYTVEALKEMDLNVEDIDDMGTANTWRDALEGWFADAGNGITNFFSKTVTTNQLCVKDSDGETCLSRTQVDQLLNNQNGGSTVSSGGGTSSAPANTGDDTDADIDSTDGASQTPSVAPSDPESPVVTQDQSADSSSDATSDQVSAPDTTDSDSAAGN